MHRIAVQLTPDQIDALRALAAEEGVSPEALVHQAVEQLLLSRHRQATWHAHLDDVVVHLNRPGPAGARRTAQLLRVTTTAGARHRHVPRG